MHYLVADDADAVKLCTICYEGERNAAFIDCGHVVACEECARQVLEDDGTGGGGANGGGAKCPVCRRGIRGVVRLWFD